MSTIQGIWNCMFSPRLIKVYDNGPIQKVYQPQVLERWGDQVIHSLYIIWKIGVYTSPILVGILYQKGYLTAEGLAPLTKFVTSIGVILIVSYCCRGYGRYQNPTYRKFMEMLGEAQKEMKPDKKLQLNFSEFEFKHWPVEFSIHDVVRSDISRKKVSIDRPVSQCGLLGNIACIPFRIIAYLAIHTFGIRLIYPGSLGFLQLILEQNLLQGRFRLIETNNGERFKLRTAENNEIDSMFIDKRNKTQNGNTLVVCCEGNAGFYEIGIMVTPITAGYSVLGWNHPGFGGSTGKPFPEQEQNAMDTVMQFAINKLGFKVENVVLFGWSIGGYASSWAAMNYPDIRGIVLDATFDDILPLALAHMPAWWGSIVRLAIREHVNLNIYEQLSKYPGPVLLVRRTEDEVICLKENDLSSNRANNLLIKLLCSRYPVLMGSSQIKLLQEFLAISSPLQDQQFLVQYNVNDSVCHSLLQSYVTEYSKTYPMTIGDGFTDLEKNQMVLFLAKKYLKDFKSTHCINLPAELFQLPWDVNDDLLDFVVT